MSEPTPKQLAFIDDISAATGIGFTGRTKQEASDYIDENIGLYRDLIEAEMESSHGDWGCRDD
ncbi:hypothetical protein [Adlercreutzia muris]|uniref:hypothetical protein n=1 Tax=Adlercreutzia muris TaxID=1796610 RepID=UPI00136581AB|nr:hypothetical protein [Adlercreutzia muris]NCA32137.1 hypothetical protein [Adlercreutzia muris]